MIFKNSKSAAFYCWNAIYGNIDLPFKKDWMAGFVEGYDNWRLE